MTEWLYSSAILLSVRLIYVWLQSVGGSIIRRRSIWCLFVLFTGCAGAAFLLMEEGNADAILRTGIETLRYGSENSEVSLSVTSEEDVILYLACTDGAAITDDCAYKGMDAYFAKSGFHPLYQLDREELAQEKPVEVTVDVIAGCRKYMYLPKNITKESALRLDASLKETGKVCSNGLWGQSRYTFQVNNREWMDWFELENQVSDDTQFAECEQIYRSYVYEHFMNIPVGKRKKYEQTDLRMLGGITAKEVALSVRDYVKPDSGKTKEQLAEEAVMLMRYCGLPAKAVNGYYINTADNIACKHSWTEVYVDGVGFIPFEVIPAYYESTEITDVECIKDTDVDFLEVEGISVSGIPHALKMAVAFVSGLLMLCCVLNRTASASRYYRMFYSKKYKIFFSLVCKYLENMLKYERVYIEGRSLPENRDLLADTLGAEVAQYYEHLLSYSDGIQFAGRRYTETEQRKIRVKTRVLLRHLHRRLPMGVRFRLKYAGGFLFLV